MNVEKINILVVEDDQGDQKLIKKALAKQEMSNQPFIAETGEKAIDYLSRSKADKG